MSLSASTASIASRGAWDVARVARVASHGLLLPITALLLGSLAPAAAQVFPVGPELQVNTYTTNDQGTPAVAVDETGGFVVVWGSLGSTDDDASETSIQRQRFDPEGLAIDGELQVNTFTTGLQGYPAVTTDATGAFVVVWQSYAADLSGYAVQGRRFDLTGVPLGDEFQVNTTTSYNQAFPSVARASSGEFVVAWLSYGYDGGGPSGYDILAQRYDAAGLEVGGELVVNTFTTGYQLFPSVSVADTGAFVVVWTSSTSAGTDTSGDSIQGQRFDNTGIADGPAFQVNTYTTDNQRYPSVALGSDGTFWVVWQSLGGTGSDSSGLSVQGQRFSSDGIPIGGELQVNGITTGDQQRPKVAEGIGGDFVVTWQTAATAEDPAGTSVRAQRFGADGTAKGGENQVNTYTTGDQGSPAITTNQAGDFLAVWQSAGSAETDTAGTSVQSQRFTLLTPPFFSDGFETGDTSGWSNTVP